MGMTPGRSSGDRASASSARKSKGVALAARAVSVEGLEGRVYMAFAPAVTSLTSGAFEAGVAGEGGSVSVVASFTDADAGDAHAAIVEWGDGTASAGTVDPAAGTVSASHVYRDGGVYPLAVTVTDAAGLSGSAADEAFVSGAGVVGGVLYLVGTNAGDKANVRQSSSGFRVEASFVATGYKDVPAAPGAISGVVMLL